MIDFRTTYHHETVETVRLFVVDTHGEYSLPGIDDDKARPRIEYVYNGHDIEDLLGAGRTIVWDSPEAKAIQGVLDTLYDAFPEALKAQGFGAHDMILAVEGHVDEIVAMWRTYYADVVFANETGGDDDTFDYWPAAVAMCRQIAADLDAIAGVGTTYADELKKAYHAYIGEHGVVPEFYWDDDTTYEDNLADE